jgi:hypothetical protein
MVTAVVLVAPVACHPDGEVFTALLHFDIDALLNIQHHRRCMFPPEIKLSIRRPLSYLPQGLRFVGLIKHEYISIMSYNCDGYGNFIFHRRAPFLRVRFEVCAFPSAL